MRTTAGWILTQHWAFKHGFLHACRHRPKRCSPYGNRELVPNQGLAGSRLRSPHRLRLVRAAFVLRHSKLARLDRLTAIAVAAQLRSGILKAPRRSEPPPNLDGYQLAPAPPRSAPDKRQGPPVSLNWMSCTPSLFPSDEAFPNRSLCRSNPVRHSS